MFANFLKNHLLPTATLSGSIIGVGFFALPYIASKVSMWVMLPYFIIVGALVIFIHLLFCNVTLKTPDFKRFPGFVEMHLGKKAKIVPLFNAVFGGFGVLLVYLIIGGEFLTASLSPIFGQNNLFYTLIYFCLGATAVYIGTKAVSKIELVVLGLLLLSFLIIFIKGIPYFDINNLFAFADLSTSWETFFLPYGAIMFSLWGMGMIPEVEEMLGKNKKNIKKVVLSAVLFALIVYVTFVFLVISITGKNTTESALVGLKNYFGNGTTLAILLIAVFTTFNAFIALAMTLKKVLMYDVGIKHNHAFIIACFTPLILFLIGINSFIPIIAFIGGVLLSIDGIFVLLMYKKISGKKLIAYSLIPIFLFGIIYEILSFIKII